MKSIITTLVVLGALIVLVLTNPSLDDFANHVRAELAAESESKSTLERAFGVLFGGVAAELIRNTTTRTNYVVASVYRARLEDEKIRCIGVLGNFYCRE